MSSSSPNNDTVANDSPVVSPFLSLPPDLSLVDGSVDKGFFGHPGSLPKE